MRFWRICLGMLVATVSMVAGSTSAQTGHAARTASIVITVTGNPSELPPMDICVLPGNRRIALTTMWDDGPASTYPGGGDLRMARMLETNGWKGTFGWGLLSGAIGDTLGILATGMEVCSHTATHPLLSTHTRNKVFWEFLTSKIYFSVLTQQPVVSYDDAFEAHDLIIQEEFYRAGFLVGRGGRGPFSITNIARRHVLPSLWVAAEGADGVRQSLASLYASAPEGTVQGFSGHAYPPEFSEDLWAQFASVLEDHRGRTDTWYATWREIGSQMFLRHAAQLDPPELGANTIRYLLQISSLPRDVLAIPLTLRMAGTEEQLNKVVSVTVDGQPVPIRIVNGALLCEVNPFAEDLYARVVTTELSRSLHPTVRQAIQSLPVVSDADLEASWTWTETGGVYQVSVSVTNQGAVALASIALEIFSSSVWNQSSDGTVPTVLPPGQGFQIRCRISPRDSENVGGWTAFGGRIDYVSRGTPRTHYLFRDSVLPISPAVKHKFMGPNCQVAGPILCGASDLPGILAEAESQWADLSYDPSDRPSMINLVPVFYPSNWLARGVRVLKSHLISDTAQQGAMKLGQQYWLAGFRFWLNGNELPFTNGSYAFTLDAGVNRLIAICDVAQGIAPYFVWPMVVTVEPAFYQPDAVTPLTGVAFTAGNVPPVIPAIHATSLCRGQTFRFQVSATDQGSSPGNLTYDLVPPVPDGAAIDSHTGLFEWTPGVTQAPGTNSITVRVTDDGLPAMSTEGSFTVIVLPDPCLQLMRNAAAGQWLLTWMTVPGRTYRVEYTADMSMPVWLAFGPDRIAGGDSLSADIIPASSAQRFFRVVRLD